MRQRVVTLAGDADREATLAIALADHPDVELLLRCVDRVELLGAIRSGRVDAIISVGQPEWFDRQCRAEAAMAGIRVVMVGPTDLNGWPDGTAIVGADAQLDEIVAFSLDASPIVAESSSPREPRDGRIIAVWGPKGAPGRTRIAIELACEISRREAPALLIDADPYGGDIAQLLGVLEELPTVIWASRLAAKGGLTMSEIATELRRIGSDGPIVLPGLPRADLWAEISDFAFQELLESARAFFPLSVVDVGFCLEPAAGATAPERNRMARTTLRNADRVIAVCRPDPPGLKNFIWAYEDLSGLTGDAPISIVLNGAHAREAKEAAQIVRRHLGKNVAVSIPDLTEVIRSAVKRGLAAYEIDRSDDLSGAMAALGTLVGATRRHRGLMGRLAGASR